MRCLIVDDEPLAHKVIRNYCEDLPYMEIVGSAHSAIEAMSFLNGQAVDLLFLDINMPKIQGLDFLKTLTNPPMVIVTTAYQEFALESYEQRVIDYLLKPFSLERFLKAVNRANDQKSLMDRQSKPVIQTVGTPTSQPETLFIKGDRKVHQIRVDEILYMESYGSYVKVHLANEMIITLERLTNYESKLAEQGFIRIHKSYLVPVSKIEVIEGNEMVVGGQRLPIGAVYRHNVNDLFK
ncbi:MAG: response regulator transcription factor [Roseivirga sp.]|nr:response regulator transcription factor [Roseivirga sp.]